MASIDSPFIRLRHRPASVHRQDVPKRPRPRGPRDRTRAHGFSACRGTASGRELRRGDPHLEITGWVGVDHFPACFQSEFESVARRLANPLVDLQGFAVFGQRGLGKHVGAAGQLVLNSLNEKSDLLAARP